MMSHHDSHRRIALLVGVTAAGSLALAAQVFPASAERVPRAAPGSPEVAQAAAPPAGETWLLGTLTDQANHRVNNVNVEVWPNDPAAVEPVASNITYAGAPEDGRHEAGVWRVAVPAGAAYIIRFSAVGGAEDGDAYRMQSYGEGRPVAARSTGKLGRAVVVTAAAGRAYNLGVTQLVRQGTVASKVTAKVKAAKKLTAGEPGTLTVKVTSPFVSSPTGLVKVRIDGKKIKRDKLTEIDKGKSTILLPKLSAGSHRVVARYQGSGTVDGSKGDPIAFTVGPKK
jgi:hypothetical protein